MTADQLRRSAALIERAADHRVLDDAASYLRACASAMEAGPVAWRYWNEKSRSWNETSSAPVAAAMQDGGRAVEPLYPVAMPTIPHGWKLVPVEATPEMMHDGSEVDLEEETPEAYQRYLRSIYRAMLAAAPTPPVPTENTSAESAGRTAEREHDPLHLSRVLHELAGAASLCWEPRPSGVFDSQQALAFVEAAIAEIRSRMPALRLPEPMTDEEIERLWTEAPGIMGALRAIEAEVLRRVKECNE